MFTVWLGHLKLSQFKERKGPRKERGKKENGIYFKTFFPTLVWLECIKINS